MSRINNDTHQINEIEVEQFSNEASIHSGVEDFNDHISIAETIVNKYFTQIHLVENKTEEMKLIFKRYRKIYITENDLKDEVYINNLLRNVLKKGTTGIFSELSDSVYNILQKKLISLFNRETGVKFIKCTIRAQDIETEEELIELIEKYRGRIIGESMRISLK